MKKIRLRTFVTLSLVFHIILITALVAIFLPERTIIKNNLYPISFGTLPQNEAINDAKKNSFNLIPLNVSKRNDTQKNNRPEKMGMSRADDNEKTINKIDHPEEKTTLKEDVKDKVSASSDSTAKETESANNKNAFSETDKETNNQRTARLGGNQNMNHKRDSGTDTLNRNIELAFPDYKVNPKPRYPMLARRKGYEGTILLRVFVLETGGVGKVELEKSSGYEILDESAFKAVKDWVFIPGKKNGEPIPSWVTVPIKFQLNSD
ncbi:MAG: energy transducer TonB [Thermodesulfobacteriota bacterium]